MKEEIVTKTENFFYSFCCALVSLEKITATMVTFISFWHTVPNNMIQSTLMTDEEIVSAVRRNQESGYRELYQKYGRMVIGHVRKNSGTEADAKELVQIVMVKFFMALQGNRYEHTGKLGHYLFQLGANSWREELRRRRTRPTVELSAPLLELSDPESDRVAELIVKDRHLNALHQALARMGNPCRDLIKNYHLKQQQLKTIATQMSYDYNALRKRLFDCRKKLKTATEALLG